MAEEKRSLMSNVKFNFKRLALDILSLVGVFALLFFLPETLMPELAKMGLLNIFMSKLIFVSAGIIHAHISRKLIWPYISFSSEKEWTNNLMIIAWYVTIIICWARGG
jgi:branched-subunit amino acid transport protein